ncbi:MAG: hypothetical protein IJN29_14835, partial [Akkermansia sp.]|nr:hypothetical protein [Akkermansia sp.]
MNKTIKTTTAGILALSFISVPLTSCSVDDTGMTQIQGSTLGALGGAVVGGAIGLAVGGDSESVVAGAIAGGLLGAMAGLQWANSIVK